MPRVNPENLRWARETAGLSLEAAVEKIGLKDNRKHTGAEKLRALEEGTTDPTRAQLNTIAKQFHQPLSVFYLNFTPRKSDHGVDFRSLPECDRDQPNPVLNFLIRDIFVRQGLVKSLLEDEGVVPLNFIGSAKPEHGVKRVANSIQTELGFDQEIFRRKKNTSEAFNYLRKTIEDAGIFVTLSGDLGNYRTALQPDIFRGFAIADPIAPYIVINSYDAGNARSFTALHEVAHLWLNATGVSGDFSATHRPGRDRIEQICNEVAAQILVPACDLKNLDGISEISLEAAAGKISTVAGQLKVSRACVAYRLWKNEMIDKKFWSDLNKRLREEWEEQKSKNKSKKKSGGPDSNKIRRHRIGTAIFQLVARSLGEGSLTPTRAGLLLGIAPNRVYSFIKKCETAT